MRGYFTRWYRPREMKAAVERRGGHFVLFGGEPLMGPPEDDLKRLGRVGCEYGATGPTRRDPDQPDRHIRMFQQFKVHVGLSITGPARSTTCAGRRPRAHPGTHGQNRGRHRPAAGRGGGDEPDRHPAPQQRHRRQAPRDARLVPRAATRARPLRCGCTFSSGELRPSRRKYRLSAEENIAALLSFAELEETLPR